MSKAFQAVIAGSPQLQYDMELEIAGLVDRPSVSLPETERLELLKVHQMRLKDPGCHADRPIIPWPQKSRSGNTQLVGDTFFVTYTTTPGDGDPFVLFDAIDIGHLKPIVSEGEDPVRWWTIQTPQPFFYLFADPSQGIIVLADQYLHNTFQVISTTSGKSVVDGDFMVVPPPGSESWWASTQVHIYGHLLATAFVFGVQACGITVLGWKDGIVRVVSFS